MFSVNPSTVTRWAAQGRIAPALVTLGGEARYRRGDVLKLIADAMHEDDLVPDPTLADELLHTRPAR